VHHQNSRRQVGACDANPQLADRHGSVFRWCGSSAARNTVLNAHRLYPGGQASDYMDIGLWAVRLLFTTESARECVLTARSYKGEGFPGHQHHAGLYYGECGR
jgi:putative protease